MTENTENVMKFYISQWGNFIWKILNSSGCQSFSKMVLKDAQREATKMIKGTEKSLYGEQI